MRNYLRRWCLASQKKTGSEPQTANWLAMKSKIYNPIVPLVTALSWVRFPWRYHLLHGYLVSGRTHICIKRDLTSRQVFYATP